VGVKRFLLIASLVLGLGFVAAPVAMPAAPGDAQGPACGNITNGDGTYTGTLGGSGTIDFTIQLQAPACSFVTYSFFVTDTNGTAIDATTLTQDSDCTVETTGGGCVHFVYDIASSPSTVCVYAMTSIHGHLVDHAPNFSDATCTGPEPSISLGLNGGVPAGGNFN
jgi:hypothetical protein